LSELGETKFRIGQVKEWRDGDTFSDKEKAALCLAEALTLSSINEVPDRPFRVAAIVFGESQMILLVAAIFAANDWFYLNGELSA
jgi:alkylhydroperoxidase family enzyme